jgi:hypothetical protein
MRAKTSAALALVAVLSAGAAGCGSSGPPPARAFFGIDPQGPTSDADAAYMRAGGIGAVRWTLEWAAVQPEAGGSYNWAGFDAELAVAARHRLRVLPLLYGEPAWVGSPTAFPLASAAARDAWKAFLRAAVERYGPGGSFWTEHGPGSAEPLPRLAVREWQVWNEANFSYFAEDVSPSDYAELVAASHAALREADPRARLILSGLFGAPKEGLDAAEFLAGIYAVPGIASDFEGIALHPYARDSERLEELVDEFRAVADETAPAASPST